MALEPKPARRRELMTITEAGERLGMPQRTAYNAAKRGMFPVVRNGSRMFVPVRAFENWLEGAAHFANWPNAQQHQRGE